MSKVKDKIAGNKAEIRRIFTNGKSLGDWAIDYNPETKESESNGGKQHLIYDSMTKQFYLIDTNWADEVFVCSPIDVEETLKEGGFMADLIKEFKTKTV